MVAGNAVAANGIPLFSAPGRPFSFAPSHNVTFYYGVDATAMNYVVNSKSMAGDKLFSSSNNTSNIWYKDIDGWRGKSVVDCGVYMTTAGQSDYSNWSSQ